MRPSGVSPFGNPPIIFDQWVHFFVPAGPIVEYDCVLFVQFHPEEIP
jgi:hypothetical protein